MTIFNKIIELGRKIANYEMHINIVECNGRSFLMYYNMLSTYKSQYNYLKKICQKLTTGLIPTTQLKLDEVNAQIELIQSMVECMDRAIMWNNEDLLGPILNSAPESGYGSSASSCVSLSPVVDLRKQSSLRSLEEEVTNKLNLLPKK